MNEYDPRAYRQMHQSERILDYWKPTPHDPWKHLPPKKQAVRKDPMIPQYLYPSDDIITDMRKEKYEECSMCGAPITRGRQTQHTNFHKTFSNRRNDTMSEVKWCDYGPGNGHAFKTGEPGSASFDGSQVGEDGKVHNERMDACAIHNPMRPIVQQAELKALTDQAYEELTHNVD